MGNNKRSESPPRYERDLTEQDLTTPTGQNVSAAADVQAPPNDNSKTTSYGEEVCKEDGVARRLF